MRGNERVVDASDLRIDQQHRTMCGRANGETQSDFLKFRGCFVDLHRDASLEKPDGQGEATDAATDNGDGEVFRHAGRSIIICS